MAGGSSLDGSLLLLLGALVGGLVCLILSLCWILRVPAPWSLRHTRFGSVDQRWLVPIALLVDCAYVATGVTHPWGQGTWILALSVLGVQAALAGLWLGCMYAAFALRKRRN
jgi:hypothetical protein